MQRPQRRLHAHVAGVGAFSQAPQRVRKILAVVIGQGLAAVQTHQHLGHFHLPNAFHRQVDQHISGRFDLLAQIGQRRVVALLRARLRLFGAAKVGDALAQLCDFGRLFPVELRIEHRHRLGGFLRKRRRRARGQQQRNGKESAGGVLTLFHSGTRD